MKKQFLLSIILIFSSFVTTSLPAFSQNTNTKAITEKPSPQTTNKITVVKALIVKFPIDIKFDAGAEKEVPLVLLTIAPIYNSAGQVVIPANSRVDAVLFTTGEGKDKGTMIVAKSLIINGNSYPINATVSTKLPARKEKGKSAVERSQEYVATVDQVLSAYTNVSSNIKPGDTTDTPESPKTNIDKAARTIASVIGVLSPRSKLISNIPKGSEYILHLEKPLRFSSTQNTQ